MYSPLISFALFFHPFTFPGVDLSPPIQIKKARVIATSKQTKCELYIQRKNVLLPKKLACIQNVIHCVTFVIQVYYDKKYIIYICLVFLYKNVIQCVLHTVYKPNMEAFMTRTDMITIRISPEERLLYEAEAAYRKQSLSA